MLLSVFYPNTSIFSSFDRRVNWIQPTMVANSTGGGGNPPPYSNGKVAHGIDNPALSDYENDRNLSGHSARAAWMDGTTASIVDPGSEKADQTAVFVAPRSADESKKEKESKAKKW